MPRPFALALASAALVVPLTAAALPAADPTTPAGSAPATTASAPATPASTQDSADLEQQVDATESMARGEEAVVDHGHIDIGPVMEDGRWTLKVRDDTANPPVWRDPEDLVIRVKDAARLPVPGGEEYAFLKMPAGTPAYVVPQTQNPAVIWIGWNTQSPPAVAAMGRGASLTFLRRQGPGSMSLFLQQGQGAGIAQLWGGKDPAKVWVDVNTHTHANWVFEKPGVQLVEVEASATAPDGKVLTDRATFRFAVGDAASEADARAAAFTGPAPSAPATAAGPTREQAGRAATSEEGDSPWLLGGVAGLVALLAVLGGLAWWRSRSARREEAR